MDWGVFKNFKMSVNNFEELKEHLGHKIVCVSYGSPIVNVSIECEDCFEVLLSFDKPNKSKSFSVNSKDLFDKKKNPKLSLSPRDILRNKKIKKKKL